MDQQLQETIRQFEQTLGVVENIDTASKQLKQALEEGKTIIVTSRVSLARKPPPGAAFAELGGDLEVGECRADRIWGDRTAGISAYCSDAYP